MTDTIEKPLIWQNMIDNAPASINMRGSHRFWATVEARGIQVVCRNSVPDFSEIVFDLGDGIGLELSTEEGSPFIKYAFVEVVQEGASS